MLSKLEKDLVDLVSIAIIFQQIKQNLHGLAAKLLVL